MNVFVLSNKGEVVGVYSKTQLALIDAMFFANEKRQEYKNIKSGIKIVLASPTQIDIEPKYVSQVLESFTITKHNIADY